MSRDLVPSDLGTASQRRRRAYFLPSVAAALCVAMLSAQVALAGYSQEFASLGCDYNQGRTWRPFGGTTMESYTTSLPTGGVQCGYGYVSAYFTDASGTYGVGPGWDVPVGWVVKTDPYSGVQSGVAAHSACMAGGPCYGATVRNSSE
jgi:hypothetical protein